MIHSRAESSFKFSVWDQKKKVGKPPVVFLWESGRDFSSYCPFKNWSVCKFKKTFESKLYNGSPQNCLSESVFAPKLCVEMFHARDTRDRTSATTLLAIYPSEQAPNSFSGPIDSERSKS